MAAEKISRKKLLKEPDEFISTTTKVIRFFSAYRRQVIRYAIVGLVVAVVGAGIFFYLEWQKGKALAMQAQALQIYEEAARKGMGTEGEKESLRKALEKFRESISIDHRGTQGQISQLYIALCHFGLQEYDAAIEAYRRCLEGPLRPMALNGIAYCYEAKKEWAQALEYFKKNAEEARSVYQEEGLMGVARCYEALNQKAKALEYYQKVLTQNPKSPMADLIQRKVSELKG